MNINAKTIVGILLLLAAAAVAYYFYFKDHAAAALDANDQGFGEDDTQTAKAIWEQIKKYDPNGQGWRLDGYQKIMNGTVALPAALLINGKVSKTAAISMQVAIPQKGSAEYNALPIFKRQLADVAAIETWNLWENFRARQLEKQLFT